MRYILREKLSMFLELRDRRRRHMEDKFLAHWQRQAREWETHLTQLRNRKKATENVAAD
jgi:hypothetical protein